MLIRELMTDIHQNAVDHGWWEEKRSMAEIIALIHSEWSEALEEARAGSPLVYYFCAICDMRPCKITQQIAKTCVCDFQFAKEKPKPEGIGVELIDGCIRILDFAGNYGYALHISVDDKSVENVEDLYISTVETDIPELIADLHNLTSLAYDAFCNDMMEEGWIWIVETLIKALSWVKVQGLDPLALLLEKHAYNKTRPYKHGKQF